MKPFPYLTRRILLIALHDALMTAIAVVLAFPNGLSGIWADYVQPRIDRLLASRKPKPKNGWTDNSVADGAPAE